MKNFKDLYNLKSSYFFANSPVKENILISPYAIF